MILCLISATGEERRFEASFAPCYVLYAGEAWQQLPHQKQTGAEVAYVNAGFLKLTDNPALIDETWSNRVFGLRLAAERPENSISQ